ACAILDARVGALDAEWHLARIDFEGGSLWARDQGLPLGQRVRVRVLARDVSLAAQPGSSSIQNVLPGRVDALGDDEHPGLQLVRVRVGRTALLARLTRRSAAALAIRPGLELWVQIKTVALMD
ncbi:MAG: molybdenum transporter ATP-binding protein, partial [Pseudomonadota bacterium]